MIGGRIRLTKRENGEFVKKRKKQRIKHEKFDIIKLKK
jgi:hypothetical protein